MTEPTIEIKAKTTEAQKAVDELAERLDKLKSSLFDITSAEAKRQTISRKDIPLIKEILKGEKESHLQTIKTLRTQMELARANRGKGSAARREHAEEMQRYKQRIQSQEEQVKSYTEAEKNLQAVQEERIKQGEKVTPPGAIAGAGAGIAQAFGIGALVKAGPYAAGAYLAYKGIQIAKSTLTAEEEMKEAVQRNLLLATNWGDYQAAGVDIQKELTYKTWAESSKIWDRMRNTGAQTATEESEIERSLAKTAGLTDESVGIYTDIIETLKNRYTKEEAIAMAPTIAELLRRSGPGAGVYRGYNRMYEDIAKRYKMQPGQAMEQLMPIGTAFREMLYQRGIVMPMGVEGAMAERVAGMGVQYRGEGGARIAQGMATMGQSTAGQNLIYAALSKKFSYYEIQKAISGGELWKPEYYGLIRKQAEQWYGKIGKGGEGQFAYWKALFPNLSAQEAEDIAGQVEFTKPIKTKFGETYQIGKGIAKDANSEAYNATIMNIKEKTAITEAQIAAGMSSGLGERILKEKQTFIDIFSSGIVEGLKKFIGTEKIMQYGKEFTPVQMLLNEVRIYEESRKRE